MLDRVAGLGLPGTAFLSRAMAPLAAAVPQGWRALLPTLQRLQAGSARACRERRHLTDVMASICERSYTLDRNWRVTSATPKLLEWMRMKESDVLGVDLRVGIPTPIPLRRAIELALSTGQAAQVEFESVTRPGRRVEYQIRPFADGVTLLLYDVTDRSLAPQVAEKPTAMLQDAESTPAALALLDESGVVVAHNNAWVAMLPDGCAGQKSSQVGGAYTELCKRILPRDDAASIEKGLKELQVGTQESFSHFYSLTTDDRPDQRRVRIMRFEDPNHRFLVIHEDATDLARAAKVLHHLSKRLDSTERETRRQIATELHDSSNAHFVTLGLGLARLRSMTADRPECENLLNELSRSVAAASKEIRVLSFLKSPPELLEDGLEATARRYVYSFGVRTGLRAQFHAPGAVVRATPSIEHAAFRVLQEALSNVYRHAAAQSVTVIATNKDGVLTLQIADDGKGIGPRRRGVLDGSHLGVGIPGMRARVAQLGGVLEVTSDAAGTVVTATFPSVTSTERTLRPSPSSLHRRRRSERRRPADVLPLGAGRPSADQFVKDGAPL